MRRVLLRSLLVMAALAAVAPGPVAAAGEQPRLVPIRTLAPEGSQHGYVVSALGGPPFTGESVQVLENGHPVLDLKVRPQRDGLNQALVVDTSNSMRGAPLEAALRATAELLRTAPEDVRVAVYGFNNRTTQLSAFGGDRAAGAAAVEGARTGEGTHIYDAVIQAAEDLGRTPHGSRTIIVISDGTDVGSSHSLAAAAAAASRVGARVYAIGLKSPQFDPGPLTDLAERTGGTYTEVTDARSLARVETSLSRSLGREFEVTWTSNLTQPGASADVSIRAPGYTSADVRYAVPTMAVVAHAPTFWDTELAEYSTVALAGLLVFMLLAVALRPRRETVGERLAEYQMATRGPVEESVFLDDLLDRTDQRIGRLPFVQRLELRLDRADVEVRASSFLLATAGGGLALGLLGTLLLGTPTALLVAPVVPLAGELVLRLKGRRRVAAFSEQLPDNLVVLSQSLRAGFALLQALDAVADNAAEPSRKEFRRVMTQAKLGAPIEVALEELGGRMQSKELGWVVAVVAIQSRVGGNMAEIFDSVADAIQARQRLRRQVKALTAQGRMTQVVLTSLPAGVGAMLYIINPDFMNTMLEQRAGVAVLLFAGFLSLLGSWTISRIVNIEI